MEQVTAEVITIGDEILFGQITDTNTQFISTELSKIGIRVVRKSSVGDSEQAILQILAEATERADVIITTGGLGPTKDDITKTTIAAFFGAGMILHQPTLDRVTEFFTKRGRPMIESNRKQAEVPTNCKVLTNQLGTAPGMWFEEKGKVYISMPGVPFEMKQLMQDGVVENLKKRFQLPVIYHQMVHTVGVGESFLAQTIEQWEDALPPHIKLAYLPSLGIVKLRLTATGENRQLIENEVAGQTEALKKLIGPHIFGYGENGRLEEEIGKLLLQKRASIATAESCTGGHVAHMLTSIPGSSRYYKGSVVAYDNAVKISQLKVSELTLVKHGAVSEETVLEMAEGVRRLMRTTVGLSVSGIAGPDGGSEEKPVGTVWVGYTDENKTVAKKFIFGNNRENNIRLASVYALNFVRQNLEV